MEPSRSGCRRRAPVSCRRVVVHLARLDPRPVSRSAARLWARDPRFSDTAGWSNRPSRDGEHHLPARAGRGEQRLPPCHTRLGKADEGRRGRGRPVSDVTSRLSTALAKALRTERELGAGNMATVYLRTTSATTATSRSRCSTPSSAPRSGASSFLSEIRTTARRSTSPHPAAAGQRAGRRPPLLRDAARDRRDPAHSARAHAPAAGRRGGPDRPGSRRRARIRPRARRRPSDIKPENILLREATRSSPTSASRSRSRARAAPG